MVSTLNTIEESTLLLQTPKEDKTEFYKKVLALQNELTEKGFEYLMGNHIIIEHSNGEFSYYMHLKTGSVNVKPGDHVKQGEQIAALGQSGMSSEPHLHFQLSIKADLLRSRCLPIVFKSLKNKQGNILYGEVVQTEN